MTQKKEMIKKYLIHRPNGNLYVHSNPNTKQYYINNQVTNPAIFNSNGDATKYISVYLDGTWKILELI